MIAVVQTGNSGGDGAGGMWRLWMVRAAMPLGFCRWHCIVSKNLKALDVRVVQKVKLGVDSWYLQIFSNKSY